MAEGEGVQDRGVNYYNENDQFAAAWLRELIIDKQIPHGDVDERDIRDVRPVELRRYTQCHFFAGIGGWSYALRLAGWFDDRPVWTGSCPCQPFSAAGRGGGFADERHLWPAFFHLIGECRPDCVFGEQVETAIRTGWLDLVRADLEGEGYALGTAVLGAHSVGAPHIRQRLFWMADAHAAGLGEQRCRRLFDGKRSTQRHDADGCGLLHGLADSISPRLERRDARALGHECEAAERGGEIGTVGDTPVDRRQQGQSVFGRMPERGSVQRESRRASEPSPHPWSDIIWLPCRNGKARPAQPGIQPLAHGIPNRVGTLRGAGNAIVPQVAAEFIRASMT